MPLLAVARELQRRGRRVVFVGTRHGIEARLVPAAGFPIHYVEIGGLKRVGWRQILRTLWQLPLATAQAMRMPLPAAVFSLGGYAAGPPVLAALLRRAPLVVMEPNVLPGFTNRRIARFVSRALISFPESARYFPEGRTDLTGLPVREEFFSLPGKRRGEKLHLLVTGGSRGARSLNEASRQSWPLFRKAGFPIRFLLQAGRDDAARLEAEFSSGGLEGEVVPFLDDMPSAFAQADLIVSRSGAGAVAELAAAGKPGILVPFPFAADQHQLRNAEAFERAGAARLVLNRDLTGERLFEIVTALAEEPGALERMAQAARKLARPGAARRAAEILEEVSKTRFSR